MRTPWRFLGNLFPRKPAMDSAEPSSSQAPEIIALEYHLAEKEVSPQARDEPSVAEGPTPASNEPIVDTLPVEQTPGIGEEPRPGVDEVVVTSRTGENSAPAPAGIADPNTAPPDARPIEPRARPSKPVHVDSAHKRPKAAGPRTQAPPQTGPKSVFDEMVELDLEVGELRRELTRKLAQQNTQLRKMLQRFCV